jgi:hypothetical protein
MHDYDIAPKLLLREPPASFEELGERILDVRVAGVLLK